MTGNQPPLGPETEAQKICNHNRRPVFVSRALNRPLIVLRLYFSFVFYTRGVIPAFSTAENPGKLFVRDPNLQLGVVALIGGDYLVLYFPSDGARRVAFAQIFLPNTIDRNSAPGPGVYKLWLVNVNSRLLNVSRTRSFTFGSFMPHRVASFVHTFPIIVFFIFFFCPILIPVC